MRCPAKAPIEVVRTEVIGCHVFFDCIVANAAALMSGHTPNGSILCIFCLSWNKILMHLHIEEEKHAFATLVNQTDEIGLTWH